MVARRIFSLLGVGSLAVLAAACATNYVTKNHQFKLISEKTEIQIGSTAKKEIVKEYGTYRDLDWQVYLDEVGQKVAKQSDRPQLAYDFTILDTDVLNAFALPGGYIFVTRGILSEIADEAELAVVLGHEITHVAAWHGIEMLQRAGLLSALTALGIVGGAVAGDPGAAIAIGQAAGVYESMYLVGYGRKTNRTPIVTAFFTPRVPGMIPKPRSLFSGGWIKLKPKSKPPNASARIGAAIR